MTENCIAFITVDEDDAPLLRCPKCKGWLPREFPDVFNCKKCGERLEVFYDVDPDDPDSEEYQAGRICKMPEHLKNK